MMKKPMKAAAMEAKMSAEQEERERRYRAEEGLRTLTKAAEIRKDAALMRDVKMLHKTQAKAVGMEPKPKMAISGTEKRPPMPETTKKAGPPHSAVSGGTRKHAP